jgi:uncharacterized protein YidB (DUF937 family)
MTMSLFDSLMGQGQDSGSGLMGVVGTLIDKAGGLQGLIGQLQQSGLGEQVASWVSRGENLPVSTEQLGTALQSGPLSGVLQQAAQKLGVDAPQLLQQLSGLLPQAVDKLTPEGQVPQGGVDLGALAGMAAHLFGR